MKSPAIIIDVVIVCVSFVIFWKSFNHFLYLLTLVGDVVCMFIKVIVWLLIVIVDVCIWFVFLAWGVKGCLLYVAKSFKPFLFVWM